MAVIESSELKWYETTTGPGRGGAITATEVTPSTLFDAVTGDEATAGATEYRGVYFKNTSANASGLQSAYVWIDTNTPGDDAITIALCDEGASASMEVIAEYTTAPDGPSFAACANKAAGLSLGTLAANAYYGIWIRRVVGAGCGAYNNNGFVLKVEGDSSA